MNQQFLVFSSFISESFKLHHASLRMRWGLVNLGLDPWPLKLKSWRALNALCTVFVAWNSKQQSWDDNTSLFTQLKVPSGSWDGSVVRTLASHQCGRVRFPDSASFVGWVCCWFSPLLRDIFLRYSGFPISSKPTSSNSNSIWIIVKHFITSLWLGRLRKHSPCYWR